MNIRHTMGVLHLFSIKNTFYDKMDLTLSWRRPFSYRKQSIYLFRKSMDWFLYDNGVRHEKVKCFLFSSDVMISSLGSLSW